MQAVGHIPINVKEMNADLLSFSGHKLGSMKGVGVLYAKKGLRLPPFIHGGGQERGGRSGTEADIDCVLDKLPGIVAKLRDMSPVWHETVNSKEVGL